MANKPYDDNDIVIIEDPSLESEAPSQPRDMYLPDDWNIVVDGEMPQHSGVSVEVPGHFRGSAISAGGFSQVVIISATSMFSIVTASAMAILVGGAWAFSMGFVAIIGIGFVTTMAIQAVSDKGQKSNEQGKTNGFRKGPPELEGCTQHPKAIGGPSNSKRRINNDRSHSNSPRVLQDGD